MEQFSDDTERAMADRDSKYETFNTKNKTETKEKDLRSMAAF